MKSNTISALGVSLREGGIRHEPSEEISFVPDIVYFESGHHHFMKMGKIANDTAYDFHYATYPWPCLLDPNSDHEITEEEKNYPHNTITKKDARRAIKSFHRQIKMLHKYIRKRRVDNGDMKRPNITRKK